MPGTPRPIDSFRERLAAFAGELNGVEQGSVDALHRARVASRRLRELVPLLELDHDTARKITRRLRKVTRQFGTVRELDVLIRLIDDLDNEGGYPSAALTTLSQVVGHRRDVARERLSEKLPASRLERLVNRLERAVNDRKSNDANRRGAGPRRSKRAWLWALDARLARRAARVQSTIEAAGALYAAEPLHDVRIALKKLRYAAELSLEAGRPRLTTDLSALKAAQELLGRLHDYEVLVALGREVQASLFPPNLAMWRELKRLVHAIEDDCRQMHARYMRDRTRLIAIAGRFGAGQTVAPDSTERAAG